MKAYDQIAPLLPDRYAVQLREADFVSTEEFRFGVFRPVRIRSGKNERELWPPAEPADVEEVLQRACRRSVYAYKDAIAQGFVTVEGGHRIGICGTGVMHDGTILTIREPTSLNIRVARSVLGCADSVIAGIHSSVLLLGPPGSGKTTLLRDLIRQLSDRANQTVSVADERGEIAAVHEGKQAFDLGKRTDVLSFVPKADAMIMLLRAMTPDWIAVDEITSPADLNAMAMISYCGVNLIATAHGRDISELQARPLYRSLLKLGIFRHVIILNPDKSCRMEVLTP